MSDGVGDYLLRHEEADVLGAPVDDVRAEGKDVLVRDLELLLLFSVCCPFFWLIFVFICGGRREREEGRTQ